ncbi:hypothetical protein AAKU52_001860, partial [Pedobacter sp. CG_S7]
CIRSYRFLGGILTECCVLLIAKNPALILTGYMHS